MIIDDTTFYTIIIVMVIMLMIIFMTIKYVRYGLRFAWNKQKYKDNMGQILIRNKSGSFALNSVVFIDVSKVHYKNAEGIFPYDRKEFNKVNFFGIPTLLLDAEDCKTTIGLYERPLAWWQFYKKNSIPVIELLKQDVNRDGEAVYHVVTVQDPEDKERIFQVKTDIPVLIDVKPSITLDPFLVRAVVLGAALTQAIAEFMKKHQLLVILIGVSILFAGVSAYFAYSQGGDLASLRTMISESSATCARALNMTLAR